MVEREEKIMLFATHAGEDPERASLPFVVGNAALAMDVKAIVVLQGTGVYLAKKGYIENVFAGGLPPLKELVDNFTELGGRIFVCSPCIKERQIDPSELIEGSEVVAAGTLVQELLSASASLVY